MGSETTKPITIYSSFVYPCTDKDLKKLERYCQKTFKGRLIKKLAEIQKSFFDKAFEQIRSAEEVTGLDYLEIKE